MTIINDFDYVRVSRIEEACELLQYKKAQVLAGGTDLVLNLKNGSNSPSLLLDIKGIKALSRIDFKNNQLSIGALVTFSDLIESKHVHNRAPVLMEMARTVASVSIRNRATMMGNICSAVPCMDSGAILSVYDAVLSYSDSEYDYEIDVQHWFKGPRKTCLKKNQIATNIAIPIPFKKHGAAYIKLGRYRGEDLAQASVAVLVLPDYQYRLAFGSVAPIPIRARKIESFLNGKPLSPDLIEQAKILLEKEIAPIDDIRASKNYRMHMAKIMLERGLLIAQDRLNGNGPCYGTFHLDV